MLEPKGNTVFMNEFGKSKSIVIVQEFLSLQNGAKLVDTIVNSWVTITMTQMMAMSSNTKTIKLLKSFFFCKTRRTGV